MTDSNIQPPDNGTGIPDSVVPGTDVTYTTPAGLYPETTGDINIDTTAAEGTFTVDTNTPQYDSTGDYAGAVDFQVDNMPHAHAPDARLDHVLEHLHNLEAKIDSLHARLDAEQDHGPEVPPTYEGHVVLHATHQPPV